MLDSVNNEQAIDVYIMKNLLNRSDDLSYTPVKSLITLKYIDKFKINFFLYSILAFVFVLFSPFFFLRKLFKYLRVCRGTPKEEKKYKNETVILMANSRIMPLVKDILKDQSYSVININQPESRESTPHIYSYLSKKDLFAVYFQTLYSIVLLLFRLERKTDILRAYMAYDLLLVAEGLDKTVSESKSIFFANHYDRWATLFDQVSAIPRKILVQHGLLPKNLFLPYPLQNLDEIYVINEESKHIFQTMFSLKDSVVFEKYKISLSLIPVEHEFSILVIGQPHSAGEEIELVRRILKCIPRSYIYIKPHPIYGVELYSFLEHEKNLLIINDKSFFPKVDVVLNYESTLGLEYEQNGVPVIDWKDISSEAVISRLEVYLQAKDTKSI